MSEAGAGTTPVVFVHGLWLHADSWGAWIDLFRGAGYPPTAPGWPGDSSTIEETRKGPERLAGHGIDDVVQHYAGIIGGLDTKPIVIGHSFGGLVAQRLLGQDLAAAAVAIDPAPIKGVLAGLADGRAVPLRLRQRRLRLRVEGALRTVDDPFTGKAPVRGCLCELLSTLAGQGRDRQRDTGASAHHRRRPGPHRPGGDQQIDPQAVPQFTCRDGLQGVPRPRPFAGSRQRLARGRRQRADLAQSTVAVAPTQQPGCWSPSPYGNENQQPGCTPWMLRVSRP